MNIVVTGSDGFIGSAVVRAMEDEHSLIRLSTADKEGYTNVDLTDEAAVQQFIRSTHADAIVHCAGIVENSERARLNITMTMNLLHSVVAENSGIKRIVVLGSASEYGEIDRSQLPVVETQPVAPVSTYGAAKAEEVSQALQFADEHHLSVVVGRIFNPVGKSMHERLLIPQILKQLDEIEKGTREDVEVARADASRDYVNVDDVAHALSLLATSQTLRHRIYNIGSGISTTNQRLIEILVRERLGDKEVSIRQTTEVPEKTMAVQANIDRIREELKWQPSHSLEATVKEIIHG